MLRHFSGKRNIVIMYKTLHFNSIKRCRWIHVTFRNLKDKSELTDNRTLFEDPCEKLQQFLTAPLFRGNEKLFSASDETLRLGQKLFTASKRHDIKFTLATSQPERFPAHKLPEVAFFGRSNVGKSSLIKAMLKNSPNVVVKTSKKPGHTKSVNFFTIGKSLCLVDLPGYGERQPKTFVDSVEPFLCNRTNLIRTFFLMDCTNLWTEFDSVALDMIEAFKIPYALILTKIDKCSKSEQVLALMKVRQFRDRYMSNGCYPQPFLISSTTLEGIGVLQTFIGTITGNIQYYDDKS